MPAPIYFRAATMPAAASYPHHRHPWGEFVYSYRGVMEVRVGQRQYLAPLQYGLWLPPEVAHQGFNRQEACHCSLYVSAELCRRLPASPCALTVSPLIGALLAQLRQRPPRPPYTEEDDRRQRLRVVRAMTLLAEGRKVESIALDLGYAGASAFIAMFRRLTGMTPDEYRRHRRADG